jgi:F-type H+-transporting ATPase subunit gamma
MKITRAMEMIAASRIMKAQRRVEAARPYEDLLTKTMEDVARRAASLSHPLLEVRPQVRSAGVFIVTSDRGLAGAYNSNVLRRAERLTATLRERGVRPVLYVSGKKGRSYFHFRQVSLAGVWTGISEVPPYAAAEDIGRTLVAAYEDGTIDELHAVYTDFRSAFTMRATDKKFLPIATAEVVEGDKHMVEAEYFFEPDPDELLGELLPQYLVTKIFAVLLESAASENAARRRAMKSATENAEDLIKVLTRRANQARQSEITTEIMEIVGGAEALSAAAE